MQDLTGKTTGSNLTAAEWNQLPQEVQNIITDLGIVLSGGDTDQLGKALALFLAAGTFYTDSGAADAYVLTAIGTRQAPASYSDGMYIRFRAANANTGAATVNVNALGVKTMVREDGNTLNAGDIGTSFDCIARFDATADKFFIPFWAMISVGPEQSHPLPFGYISGLEMTRAATSVSISAGAARNEGNTVNISRASALVKTTADWTAGSGNGGFPEGALGPIGNNTWYHVFIIEDGAGTVDGGYDTALNATNLLGESGYTNYRRIGSVRTDGAGNIIDFIQEGDEFRWVTPVEDVNVTNPGTTRVLATLTVPTGIRVMAHVSYSIDTLSSSNDPSVWIRSTDQADEAATKPRAMNNHDGNQDNYSAGASAILTDTSAQIAYRWEASGGNDDFYMQTYGWTDRRGK